MGTRKLADEASAPLLTNLLWVAVRDAQRTYSVAEANAVLPDVRRLVEQIVTISALLPELQASARLAQYRANRAAAAEEDRRQKERQLADLRLAEDTLAAALAGLGALGVTLKEARTGLVDFLSHRKGELVELCWRLGEDSVAHWHRIGEGFAGRQPL